MRSTSAATSARRCSQLSMISSASRVLAHAHNVSIVGSPCRSGTPNASRIVAATSAPSSSAASDANHTPSVNSDAESAATCSASRDLPTPPGPVSVTSRSLVTSPASSFTSSVRPTKLVRCTGRLPGSSSSVRSGGNSPVPSCSTSIGLPRSRKRCSPRLRTTRSGTSSAVTADNNTCPP